MNGSSGVEIRKSGKKRSTVIDLTAHVVFTLLLSWFFYYFTERWTWAVITVFGGILIDIDHFIDYFLHFGWKFNLEDFFESRQLASGKVFLFFHSWELVLLIWTLSVLFSWMIPLAAGMTLHLLIDCLYSHRRDILFLSLIYRWRNRFRTDKLNLQVIDTFKRG
jgi:hypothetical protein